MRNRLIAGVFVVALLGAACGGGDDGGSDAAAGSGEGSGSSAPVELTTADFKFEPADISVAAGGSIELTNDDDTAHSLTAEDAGIDQEVDAKGSTTIDIGDAEPGTYEYICKFHPEMKGSLEITE